MASGGVGIPVHTNSDHLVRYGSEWDPRSTENNMKGGYIVGAVDLAPLEEVLGQGAGLCIFTVPAFSPDDEEEVRQRVGEQWLHIHPTLIKIVRKGAGKWTDIRKEPVKNVFHNTQHFKIVQEDVCLMAKFLNRTSSADAEGPDEPDDDMFALRDDFKLGKV